MSTEKFANGAQSTLNGGIASNQTALVITSTTSFPPTGQFRILIDNEIIIVDVVTGVNWSGLHRGSENTSPVIHANGATVTHILTAGGLSNNPRSMSAQGDIEYLDVNGVVKRLPIGTTGQLLTVAAAVPTWNDASSNLALLNAANQTFTGNLNVNGTIGTAQGLFDSGSMNFVGGQIITLPAGNINDLTIADTSVIELDVDVGGGTVLTGIVAPAAGNFQMLFIIPNGIMKFAHQNALSLVNNRFWSPTGADKITATHVLALYYSGWRLFFSS